MAIINAGDGHVLLAAAHAIAHSASTPLGSAMHRVGDAPQAAVGWAPGAPAQAMGPVAQVVTSFRWPRDPRPIQVGWWMPRFLLAWLHAG